MRCRGIGKHYDRCSFALRFPHAQERPKPLYSACSSLSYGDEDGDGRRTTDDDDGRRTTDDDDDDGDGSCRAGPHQEPASPRLAARRIYNLVLAILVCKAMCVPWVVEQPRGSLMELHPAWVPYSLVLSLHSSLPTSSFPSNPAPSSFPTLGMALPHDEGVPHDYVHVRFRWEHWQTYVAVQ